MNSCNALIEISLQLIWSHERKWHKQENSKYISNIRNCLKIREESKRLILEKQVFAKKLKQLTWNRMKVHLKGINGLKNNYIVYNYQIKKRSKEEQRMIDLILELRRSQKREIKKRSLDDSIDP